VVIWNIHVPLVQRYLRVVRNEDTVVLKKGCLDLYTVKAGCRLPVRVLVD